MCKNIELIWSKVLTLKSHHSLFERKLINNSQPAKKITSSTQNPMQNNTILISKLHVRYKEYRHFTQK